MFSDSQVSLAISSFLGVAKSYLFDLRNSKEASESTETTQEGKRAKNTEVDVDWEGVDTATEKNYKKDVERDLNRTTTGQPIARMPVHPNAKEKLPDIWREDKEQNPISYSAQFMRWVDVEGSDTALIERYLDENESRRDYVML